MRCPTHASARLHTGWRVHTGVSHHKTEPESGLQRAVGRKQDRGLALSDVPAAPAPTPGGTGDETGAASCPVATHTQELGPWNGPAEALRHVKVHPLTQALSYGRLADHHV
jgi:hypothetical protein